MLERAAIDRGARAAIDIHPTSLCVRPGHTRAATRARTASAADGLVVVERGVRHDDGTQVIDVEAAADGEAAKRDQTTTGSALGHALRETAISERHGTLATDEHAATFAVAAEFTRAAHSHVLLEIAVGERGRRARVSASIVLDGIDIARSQYGIFIPRYDPRIQPYGRMTVKGVNLPGVLTASPTAIPGEQAALPVGPTIARRLARSSRP